MKLRINAPAEQLAPLLERFAHLGLELDLADASRNDAIAAANTAADQIALPIIKEMDEIRAAVEPWWKRNGATLLTGKRKTVELGGCMVGSKAGRSSLQFAGGDDTKATAALQAHRWAKPYVRVSYSPDKTAIATALTGKHAEQFRALGFSKPAGDVTFVLERVKQEGTVTG
jgi:hypothetical protein